jgi:hypothetical protein
MKKIARIIHRTRHASLQEWLSRARQLRFTVGNWGASLCAKSLLPEEGCWRSLRVRAEEVAPWWCNRAAVPQIDRAQVQNLQALYQHRRLDPATAGLVQRAELLAQGRMPLFSFPPVDFEGPDRWHRDPVLGKVAPRDFYGRLAYLDVDSVGDSKFTWEPNRFGWAYALGTAYQVTRDERYAATFCRLTEDWFAQNRYPWGINYCSALEVAIRNYAWLWALQLFAKPLRQRTTLIRQLLTGIWQGCRHVEENLSSFFSPNTHLTGEAFSLLAVGMSYPEFAEAQRWLRLGEQILVEEAGRQVMRDGTHAELSTGYQLYTSDIYLQAVALAQQTKTPLDPRIAATARRLAIRLADLALPASYRLPAWNDCDGGRLTGFALDPLDARPALAMARRLFPHVGVWPATMEAVGEGKWLACSPVESNQREEKRLLVKTPGRDLHANFDSGMVVHRNHAGDYLLFSASPFGYQEAPHSHDGPLRCVVYLGGEPVLIDPGTGHYTVSETERNQFRGALGKNVLTLDGRGPSVPGDFFSWRKQTPADLVEATWFDDGFRCRGKHTGYSSDERGYAYVQREITMLDRGLVAIVDRWDADLPVAAQLRMTFAPQVTLDAAEPQRLRLPSGKAVFLCVTALEAEDFAPLCPVPTQIPYSADYGAVSVTRGVRYDLRPVRRGGCVTIVSRMGPVVSGARRDTFHVAGEPDLRLTIGRQGTAVQQGAELPHVSWPSPLTPS